MDRVLNRKHGPVEEKVLDDRLKDHIQFLAIGMISCEILPTRKNYFTSLPTREEGIGKHVDTVSTKDADIVHNSGAATN